MTLAEAVARAAARLAAEGIEDAQLEAEVLLRCALNIDRAVLFTRLKEMLPLEQAAAYSDYVERRLLREPSAYICGHKEFFGIDLEVNPDVLIPRPETEILVEKAIALAATLPQPVLAADVGTGSGAIAIAFALNVPQAMVYATDISEAALNVARRNCERHWMERRITLLHGDLLQPLPQPVHMILANVPYVGEKDSLQPEIAEYEPALALYAQDEGLGVIKKLLNQAGTKLLPGGTILLEIGYDEGETALRLARDCFPCAKVDIMPDLSGQDRVLSVVLGR